MEIEAPGLFEYPVNLGHAQSHTDQISQQASLLEHFLEPYHQVYGLRGKSGAFVA